MLAKATGGIHVDIFGQYCHQSYVSKVPVGSNIDQNHRLAFYKSYLAIQ